LPPLTDTTEPLTYEFVGANNCMVESTYPVVTFSCAYDQAFAVSSVLHFHAWYGGYDVSLVRPCADEEEDVDGACGSRPQISFGRCSLGKNAGWFKIRIRTARNTDDSSLRFRVTGTVGVSVCWHCGS
jgi:hypothetical protein